MKSFLTKLGTGLRKMKKNGKNIGILYDGTRKIDWDINFFEKSFKEKGISVILFDVNKLPEEFSQIKNPDKINLQDISSLVNSSYTFWMNRVYPSEASPSTINKGLNVVSWLNHKGYQTINSLLACKVDYNKLLSWELMNKNKIVTPYTRILTKEDDIDTLVNEFSLPLIIKRNTGGKGIGVSRIETPEKLIEYLENPQFTSGNYLVQEFIPPSRDHDIRVGVVGGEAIISYGRTLVAKNGESPWMASCGHGSEIIPYRASDEECDLAIRATKAINATLNEVDIQITEKGPVIIENNPTPGYSVGEEHWVKLIVDHIAESRYK